jgi:hypothetical protein
LLFDFQAHGKVLELTSPSVIWKAAMRRRRLGSFGLAPGEHSVIGVSMGGAAAGFRPPLDADALVSKWSTPPLVRQLTIDYRAG